MGSGFAAAQRPGMTTIGRAASALARLEAGIDLVDDVDASLAPHDAAVLVALLQRLQRIGDLHDTGPREGAEHRERDAPGQSLSMFQNTIGVDLRMPCTFLRASQGRTY